MTSQVKPGLWVTFRSNVQELGDVTAN